MKVVFLADDFPPRSMGGAGVSTYELALGVLLAGNEVSVITTCRRREEEGESLHDGLTVISIHSEYPERWREYRSVNNRRVVRQVEVLLKQINPDIVHANNIHQYLSYGCLKAARQHARAVVYTARDTMPIISGKLQTARYLSTHDPKVSWLDRLRSSKKRLNPLREWGIRRYVRFAHKIVAVSTALETALIRNGIRNTVVIHTGIRAEVASSEESVTSFREVHGLRGAPLVLCAGRLSKAKGAQAVLEAFVEVVHHTPHAKLVFAGNLGSYGKVLSEKAARHGISHAYMETGWLSSEDMKTAYRAAAAVVVPSLYLDPFPRTALEAMAAEKPVVATCYGGAPEAVEDGVTGYVVNPSDSRTMGARITDLLEHPDRARQFGQAGRKRLENSFSFDDYIQSYLRLYRDILGTSA